MTKHILWQEHESVSWFELDTISAGANCSFLGVCQSLYRVSTHVTYCLDIMPRSLPAHTHRNRISNYRSYRESESWWLLFFSWGFFPTLNIWSKFSCKQGPGVERKYLSCGCSFLLWDPCSRSALGSLVVHSFCLEHNMCFASGLRAGSRGQQTRGVPLNSSLSQPGSAFSLASVHMQVQHSLDVDTCNAVSSWLGQSALSTDFWNICVLPSVNKMSGFRVLGNGPLLCQHTLDPPPTCSPPSSESCNELMGG